jgi:hypothetical protein
MLTVITVVIAMKIVAGTRTLKKTCFVLVADIALAEITGSSQPIFA